jgi:hypothetical protein
MSTEFEEFRARRRELSEPRRTPAADPDPLCFIDAITEVGLDRLWRRQLDRIKERSESRPNSTSARNVGPHETK